MLKNKIKEPNDWIAVKKSTKQKFKTLLRNNENIIDNDETHDSFLNKLMDLYQKMFKTKLFKRIEKKYNGNN